MAYGRRLDLGEHCQGFEATKLVKKAVITLSDEEIIAILHALNLKNHWEARNVTIFMLLLDSGLRIGELVSLKMEDVHMGEGFLKVMGKGKKERIVAIGNNAQKALQRYLLCHRPRPAHPGIKTSSCQLVAIP